MRSREIADLLEVATTTIPRLARRAGVPDPIGGGDSWSPGDALALMVLQRLDGRSEFAESARKCGEALDARYVPAYLVTRGGPELALVLEGPQADNELVALLLLASDAGTPVRVLKLRPMVEQLEPWTRELVTA